MIEGITLTLILASVIIMGFIGNYLFKRTGVPEMLFLIGLGIIFGPILGVFNFSEIMDLAPYVAALSLVIILFDGGLRMSIHEVFSESPRATLLATSGFVLSLIIVGLFMYYGLGLPSFYAVLFGALYGGGGSSVAVLSLVRRVGISERCETVLSLESVIDDVLCTVGSLVIIGIIITGNMDSTIIAKDVASQFSIGIVIGATSGFMWLITLRKIAKESYARMLTLAIAFFAFSVSEYLGGNGALSSLLFGIVLGNEKEIFKMFNRALEQNVIVDTGLIRFEEEVAFFTRSFFFVYLGLLTVAIDLTSLVWGVSLSILLMLIRYGTVRLSTIRSPLCEERSMMSVVSTRGLVAAILATMPLQYGLFYADLYLNITLVVIISTAIFSTVGVYLLKKRATTKKTSVEQEVESIKGK